MTKKRAGSLGFGLLLMLAASGSALAQDIGFVNVASILQQHPGLQELNETLRSEFAPREAELQTMQTELQDKAERYENDRDVLSESERTALERELTQGQRDLERRANELQEDLQIRQNELAQVLQQEIAVAIREYVSDAGYDLVVADAIYVSDSIDITEEVFDAITEE